MGYTHYFKGTAKLDDQHRALIAADKIMEVMGARLHR